MSKNLKSFLFTFLLIMPLVWGINALETEAKSFFFWREIAENPQILAAQVNQQNFEQKIREMLPVRDRSVADINIEAKAGISVLVSPDEEKILWQKNADKRLAIASLSKLMAGYVVLQNYDMDEFVEISQEAAEQPGKSNFKAGEVFKIKDLLYPMFIESSNTATFALAEVVGNDGFRELMNLSAQDLGLVDTYFVNSTGLDFEDPFALVNYSNSHDLVKLAKYLVETKSVLWKILSLPEIDLYTPEGVFHHKIVSTNQFLLDEPGVSWQERIIGGKTGFTYEAGECFLLILKAPKNKGYLINVVLGTENRFDKMEKLVNWTLKAFKW